MKNVILDVEDTDDKGYILCITPSRDYDRYLRDNVFSNINGGAGIFGARMLRKYPWTRTYTYIDSGVPRRNFTPDEYSDPRNKENYYERTRNH